MEIIDVFNPSPGGCNHTIIQVRLDDGSEQDFHYHFEDLSNVNYISDEPGFCAIRSKIFEIGIKDRKDLKNIIKGMII